MVLPYDYTIALAVGAITKRQVANTIRKTDLRWEAPNYTDAISKRFKTS